MAHTHAPAQTHAQFSFVVTLLQGAFFAVFLLFCTFTKMIALIREKEDALKEQICKEINRAKSASKTILLQKRVQQQQQQKNNQNVHTNKDKNKIWNTL